MLKMELAINKSQRGLSPEAEYVPARDVSTNNTHAYMTSRQENRQARKQERDHPSKANVQH